MTTNSSSVRFTLNFVNKTIVGTKASFDKASKGFGPIYDELAVLMAKHPTYDFEVKTPKQPDIIRAISAVFLPLGIGSPLFRKTNVLLNAPLRLFHIFQEVSRLAVQEATDFVDVL